MDKNVGFIGLGMMGLPMVARLAAGGFQVIVFDIDSIALKKSEAFGVALAASPREVAARCTAVITMLPNSDIVEQVVLGKEGFIQGARPGSILVDMTTAYPLSTLKVAHQLGEQGIEMLDAPVSGGVAGAEQGKLTIMIGGKKDVVERCRPLFQAMGSNLFHMGEVGSGHTMKAVNNALSACLVAATSEVLALATKAGLEPKTVLDVLQSSTGKNYATEVKFPKYVLTRTFSDGFRIELLTKDLDIAGRLARDLKVPAFILSTVHQVFGFALAQGLGERGHTLIARLMEEWAGIKMNT